MKFVLFLLPTVAMAFQAPAVFPSSLSSTSALFESKKGDDLIIPVDTGAIYTNQLKLKPTHPLFGSAGTGTAADRPNSGDPKDAVLLKDKNCNTVQPRDGN